MPKASPSIVKFKPVRAYPSSTENSNNNAWYLNASNGSVGNNNKNNSNAVRAVVAFDEEVKVGWIEAFHECCLRKMSSKSCNDYRVDYELDLLLLMHEVYSRTYEPGTSICFMVTRPKLREVFAASFRDRIVHHWICRRINPLFEKRFQRQGNVSHNCRKGFGTTSAIAALYHGIEEVTAHWKEKAWVAKFDLKSFFMSIDCDLLWEKLEVFIKDNYKGDDIDTLLYLTKVVVLHHPENDCAVVSDPSYWLILPAHKSLRNRTKNVGMPIGNLPSQLFANFLMSFFDDWILERCAKANAHYVRFVDDFAIVCKDKDFLLGIRGEIENYLSENLHIHLNPDKFYLQSAHKGVKYVGQVLKPGRRYLASRTYGGLHNALHSLERLCLSAKSGLDLNLLFKIQHAVGSINSYFGFTVHCAGYKRRLKIMRGLNPIVSDFCYTKDGFSKMKIRKRYKVKFYLLTQELKRYGLDVRKRKAGAGGVKIPLWQQAADGKLQRGRKR